MSLDFDKVSEEFRYDAETGKVYRLPARKGRPANREVGATRKGRHYVRVRIGDEYVQLHRLAWFLHHGSMPTALLDHINGDRSDNRMSNLRLVTSKENNWNRGSMSNNVTGVHGVAWCNTKKRFRASIHCDGKSTHLGYFRDVEEAARVRRAAELKFFGEFARDRSAS